MRTLLFVLWFFPLYGGNLKDLGDSSNHWVARRAYSNLFNEIIQGRKEKEVYQATFSSNHQVSQLSALLYAKKFLREEIKETSLWPEHIVRLLVVALRDDTVNAKKKGLINNAWTSSSLLEQVLVGEVLKGELFRELEIGDQQSKKFVTTILLKKVPLTDLPLESLNDYILSCLKPTIYSWEYHRAMGNLFRLGKNNFYSLIHSPREFNEFQMACLQIVASYFNVWWHPEDEVLKKWNEVIHEKSHYLSHVQMREVALYLSPRTKTLFSDEDLFKRNRHLRRVQGNLIYGEQKERYRWMRTWYSFLPSLKVYGGLD